MGLQTLSAAGFDPRGMESFFTRLNKLSHESADTAYLRTHPLSGDRMADMQGRLHAVPPRIVAVPVLRRSATQRASYLAAPLRPLADGNRRATR